MTSAVAAEIEECLAGAPLVAAWRDFLDSAPVPFTIPGHKGRASLVSRTLGRLLAADVPLYGGLDTPKLEHGVLAEAERRAAACWQASWCRFSTGGSTHGNQVLALAAGRPGDLVLVPRTAHRSMLMGLVLAGLMPVWLPAALDGRFGLTAGVSARTVHQAVRAYPDAVALLLVEPGYAGVVSPDLAESISLAHSAGLAVIVDQAWGAHFGFHPAYPPNALRLGADAIVMSGHKTLPAFSQAAYVLAQGDRFSPSWLDRCFEASATTSPAGAILASLDAARCLLQAPAGHRLLDATARRVEQARKTLRSAGFEVPGPGDFPAGCFDSAKLVVRMGRSGNDGLDLERHLRGRGIAVEMADRSTIVPMVSLLDDDSTLGVLVDALTSGQGDGTPSSDPSTWSLPSQEVTVPAMSPRDAFFAPRRPVAFDQAIGEICAELVAPYPPGVPVMMPGERITALSLDTLRRAAAAGSRIAYAADETLGTVMVVDQ